MTDERERVVVVGAGLSGLAAAHRLRQSGREVVVLERNPVVGGCAATRTENGYVVDTGCDLINSTFVRYLALIDELGMRDRVEPSSGSIDFVRDGRPVHVNPKRPHKLLASPLLSARDKAVAVAGFARLAPTLRKFDAYSMTRYDDAAFGSGPDFIGKYFNAEIGSRVIDPLVRAFTGRGLEHATGLSVLATLAVGAAPAVAVRGGMTALPQALAARMDVRLAATVTRIADSPDGVAVTYTDGEGEHQLAADGCVVAVSYRIAAAIWPGLAEASPDALGRLEDLQLISVSLGYDAPSPTDAYPIMIPTRESSEALLGFMEQNKCSDRAPVGRTLITLFTDGAATAEMLDRTDAEIEAWAGGLVESVYPQLRGRRELVTIARWTHTGYQQFPGFWDLVKRTRDAIAPSRVRATSALFGSGGVEHAVVGGERAARSLARRLDATPSPHEAAHGHLAG